MGMQVTVGPWLTSSWETQQGGWVGGLVGWLEWGVGHIS